MISKHAKDLHFSSLLVDLHCDSLYRPARHGEDIGRLTSNGHVDLVRMREGHQTAEFMACYAAPRLIKERDVLRTIMVYIDAFYRLMSSHHDEIEQARTAADIRRIVNSGKLAAVLCIEGGHAIEDDLAVLRTYHRLGARYMTLTWNNTNNWADGVLDEQKHNGLSDFGREVVHEMERLGMMMDISHASPKTFWDVMEIATKPVIASHSSARAICKAPRNLEDSQIRALADKGGVIGVNYESTFLSERYRLDREARDKPVGEKIAEAVAKYPDDMRAAREAEDRIVREYQHILQKEPSRPHYTEIIDHIDHLVKVAGIEHVGLGSDFDGATMPVGMESCSYSPKITDELLKRGYSDEAVRKILGENVLRVMKDVIGE